MFRAIESSILNIHGDFCIYKHTKICIKHSVRKDQLEHGIGWLLFIG